MITAIFTAEATTLTIETPETVVLERLGGGVTEVERGTNQIAAAPGVYKVLSTGAVRVTSDSPRTFVQMTSNSKDGTFPDQTKLAKFSVDRDAIRNFFADAKSISPPD